MPSLLSLLSWNGPTGFGYGSTATQVVAGLDLSGKTYLITGINAGLGFEQMKALASRGASIIGLCRTKEKAELAAERAKVPPERFTPVACDLSEPAEVLAAVRSVRGVGLNAICTNAGIMALPKLQIKFGIELQYLGNHIGHFMLVTGLLPSLTPDGRVVILSSSAHQMAYRGGIRFDDLNGVNALKSGRSSAARTHAASPTSPRTRSPRPDSTRPAVRRERRARRAGAGTRRSGGRGPGPGRGRGAYTV